MSNALGRQRAHGCHQRLPQHLPAIDALPALLRAASAKQVLLQRLKVQNGDETVDGAQGLRGSWRHVAPVLDGLPPREAAVGGLSSCGIVWRAIAPGEKRDLRKRPL